MKQKHTSKKEDAVSPIVGVMLMLVATIIVAAIVAAFAGGLAAETDASPNIIISGTYSQTDGLLLKHLSGDSVSGVGIYVRPDQGFATAYYKLSWKVDEISESEVWNAGDIREVNTMVNETKNGNNTGNKYISIQPETDGAPNSGGTDDSGGTKVPLHLGTDSNFGFNNQKSIGKTMIVELHKDGRIIASTPVKIMA